MIREVPKEEVDRLPEARREKLMRQELLHEAQRLYRTYGQLLEREHRGKYVAISRDGRSLLGNTSLEVLERAAEAFGPANFMFKVGEIGVGKLR